MVRNTHQRHYAVPAADVAALLATLAGEDDRVWAHECWPPMQFDRGLVEGATGGHGPVRYRIDSVDPSREVAFTFTGPSGFDGGHRFTILELTESESLLRHELRIRPRGWARLTWPLFFRPLHDAVLEESLDKVGRHLNCAQREPHRRSTWVRLLRTIVGTARLCAPSTRKAC